MLTIRTATENSRRPQGPSGRKRGARRRGGKPSDRKPPGRTRPARPAARRCRPGGLRRALRPGPRPAGSCPDGAPPAACATAWVPPVSRVQAGPADRLDQQHRPAGEAPAAAALNADTRGTTRSLFHPESASSLASGGTLDCARQQGIRITGLPDDPNADVPRNRPCRSSATSSPSTSPGWRHRRPRRDSLIGRRGEDAFDDLAADLADGDVVLLCRGEVMALHLGIRRAQNVYRNRTRLLAQAVEGLPDAARWSRSAAPVRRSWSRRRRPGGTGGRAHRAASRRHPPAWRHARPHRAAAPDVPWETCRARSEPQLDGEAQPRGARVQRFVVAGDHCGQQFGHRAAYTAGSPRP